MTSPSKIANDLRGIGATMGLDWSQEYRQFVFDKLSEAAEAIDRAATRPEALIGVFVKQLNASLADQHREQGLELERLKGDLDDALRALEPFALVAHVFEPSWTDTDQVSCEPQDDDGYGNGCVLFTLRVHAFRRAHEIASRRNPSLYIQPGDAALGPRKEGE